MKASPEQAERLHRFAHDLRNRLIGLHQAMDHLRTDVPNAERVELAHYGDQQFFKALREVEGLMDDLGVDRGIPQNEHSTVQLADEVHRQLDLLAHRFQRKDQLVTLELEDGLAVRTDARMLSESIAALLSNASKFSVAGTSIRVRTFTTEKMALLEVVDQGTGLSAADLDQVFVRFAWLENSPTSGESQGRGTLARAHKWAAALGGDLQAASAGVGQGCTFTLSLPQEA